MRTPGFIRTFGHHFGHGLASELLDRLFPPRPTFAERFLKDGLPVLLTMGLGIAERFVPKESSNVPEASAPPPPPYFATPTAEDYKRVGHEQAVAPPTVTCSASSNFDKAHSAIGTLLDHANEDVAVQVAISQEWPVETPPPIDVLRKDLASLRSVIGKKRVGPHENIVGAAVKLLRKRGVLIEDPIAGSTAEQVEAAFDAVAKAVGDRRDKGESTVAAAARLLTEADAYIAKQAEQIRGLMLDNEFADNCGEFSARLSPDEAASIGFPNYTGQVVPVVINDGRWSVRLGANLYPVRKPEPCREAPALTTGALLQWATFALADQARKASAIGAADTSDAPIDGPCDWCNARPGQACSDTNCPNQIRRSPVVGGPISISAQECADMLRAEALVKQIGGAVKIDETAMAQNAAGGVS